MDAEKIAVTQGAPVRMWRLAPLAVLALVMTLGNGPCQPEPQEEIVTETPLTVTIVTPRDGALISDGPYTLVVAQPDDDSASYADQDVVFEFSVDGGEAWFELPAMTVWDASPGGWSAGVDATGLPSGELLLRARPTDDPRGTRGDIVSLTVTQRPVVRVAFQRTDSREGCRLDASRSYDPDGEIAFFTFWVAGETFETRNSFIELPPALCEPRLDVAVTATDILGADATLYTNIPERPEGFMWMLENSACGCTSMTIRHKVGKKTSISVPPLGNGKHALGALPNGLASVWEISADIIGNPDLCAEGQIVRRTSTADHTEMHKKACSVGLPLATCVQDSDCDTRKCHHDDGRETSVETVAQYIACKREAGASFTNNGDGACTEYPLTGQNYGNDDYTAPSGGDLGLKAHKAGKIIWVDAPGWRSIDRNKVDARYSYEGAFRSVVSGALGSCLCQFTYEFDWDGVHQRWSTAPTITLDEDASRNCTLAQ